MASDEEEPAIWDPKGYINSYLDRNATSISSCTVTDVSSDITTNEIEECCNSDITADEIEECCNSDITADEIEECCNSDVTANEIEECCNSDITADEIEECCNSDITADEIEECCDGTKTAQNLVTDVSSNATKDDAEECQPNDFAMAQSVKATSNDDPRDVEQEDLEDIDEDEYRMMMAGLRGTGKSSLANSISGKRAQVSKSAFDTVTTKAIKMKCKRQEKTLVYFDTPGLSFDKEDKEMVQNEYRKCLIKAAPGLQAILIVQKATAYTGDNQDFLDNFTKMFGENCWKWVVFVFTHVDDLNGDLEEQLKNADIRLKRWLSKCGNRYVGINNNLTGTANNKQIERLISVVTNLIETNNGEIYTNAEFQEIYQKMQKDARDKNLTLSQVRESYLSQKVMLDVGKGILKELFSIQF